MSKLEFEQSSSSRCKLELLRPSEVSVLCLIKKLYDKWELQINEISTKLSVMEAYTRRGSYVVLKTMAKILFFEDQNLFWWNFVEGVKTCEFVCKLRTIAKFYLWFWWKFVKVWFVIFCVNFFFICESGFVSNQKEKCSNWERLVERENSNKQ